MGFFLILLISEDLCDNILKQSFSYCRYKNVLLLKQSLFLAYPDSSWNDFAEVLTPGVDDREIIIYMLLLWDGGGEKGGTAMGRNRGLMNHAIIFQMKEEKETRHPYIHHSIWAPYWEHYIYNEIALVFLCTNSFGKKKKKRRIYIYN